MNGQEQKLRWTKADREKFQALCEENSKNLELMLNDHRTNVEYVVRDFRPT
jgi:hypothetical protein